MGYTTDFSGSLNITPSLSEIEENYINQFAGVRHMKRDVSVLQEQFKGRKGLPGPVGNYGVEGEFFVGDERTGVLDNNYQAKTQPGLWAQWVIDNCGETLVWDGGEKFYYYTEWLCYYIEKFFKPWGKTLNGKIEWSGEETGDVGEIHVKDNKVITVYNDKIYLNTMTENGFVEEQIGKVTKTIELDVNPQFKELME